MGKNWLQQKQLEMYLTSVYREVLYIVSDDGLICGMLGALSPWFSPNAGGNKAEQSTPLNISMMSVFMEVMERAPH